MPQCPTTALVRAGDFACKSSGMKNDFRSRVVCDAKCGEERWEVKRHFADSEMTMSCQNVVLRGGLFATYLKTNDAIIGPALRDMVALVSFSCHVDMTTPHSWK